MFVVWLLYKFYFRFPIKNEARLGLWKKAIQRIDFNPTPNSVICSEHFKEDDYLESSLNRNLLKRDAVPSVFKFSQNTDHLEACSPKRLYETRA